MAGAGIYKEMQEMDDMALLREYATSNSETAFEELVSRHVGFVYSAALRQVRDPHLAEEVTQAVFVILAQKAGRISDKTILRGWIFKTTRFVALAQMRAATIRRQHEQAIQMQTELPPTLPDPLWELVSPFLDEALMQLGEKDRQAVLLRFFENKSLAEVGSYLGTGEDTARKRVSRALEKLRRHISKRGISSTTAVIAGAISANSVQAAPVMLVKSVTAVAVAKGPAASGSTLTLVTGALKLMAWTKTKIVITGAIVVATVTTTITVVHHEIQIKQRQKSPQPIVYWSKNQIAYAGYTNPQAALKTFLWNANNGDVDAFLAGCTPGAQAYWWKDEWHGMSKAEVSALMKKQSSEWPGFRIVDQKMFSDDKATIDIRIDGKNELMKALFKKIGNDWKYDRMIRQ